MKNILHDFYEKVISLVANCLKNSITEREISYRRAEEKENKILKLRTLYFVIICYTLLEIYHEIYHEKKAKAEINLL